MLCTVDAVNAASSRHQHIQTCGLSSHVTLELLDELKVDLESVTRSKLKLAMPKVLASLHFPHIWVKT